LADVVIARVTSQDTPVPTDVPFFKMLKDMTINDGPDDIFSFSDYTDAVINDAVNRFEKIKHNPAYRDADRNGREVHKDGVVISSPPDSKGQLYDALQEFIRSVDRKSPEQRAKIVRQLFKDGGEAWIDYSEEHRKQYIADKRKEFLRRGRKGLISDRVEKVMDRNQMSGAV